MGTRQVKAKAGRPVKVPGEKSTKEKIFDAAVDLFAEKGYDGVSIRDIATAAGITEGAVYRHYSGKEEILDSIFVYVEGRLYPGVPEESLDALVEALSFQDILENIPRSMMSDPELTRATRVMVTEMYHNEKIRSYVRRELFERPVDETELLFSKLLEKGKIRPCDTRAMSTLFISYLVYWYFETFIFSYGKPADQRKHEKAAHALVHSFADLLRPDRI